jgi:hypothetical protein
MTHDLDPDLDPTTPGPDCHHITHIYVGLVDDTDPVDIAPHNCGHDCVAIFYSERRSGRRLDKDGGLPFSGDADSAKRICDDTYSDDDIPFYRLARCTTGEAFKAELGLVLKEFPDLQTEDPGSLLENMPDLFPDEFSGGGLPDLTSLWRRGTPEEFGWMVEHWEYNVVGPRNDDYEAWTLAQEFGVVEARLQSSSYYIVYRLDDEDGEAFAKSIAEKYKLIDDGYVFGQVLGIIGQPDEAVFEHRGVPKVPDLDPEWDSCWGYIGRPKDLKPGLFADARGALRRRGYQPEDVRVLDERGRDITATVLEGYEPPPVEPPTPGLDFDAPALRDSGDLCQSP